MGFLSAVPSLSGLSDVSATCVIDVSFDNFDTLFSCELDTSSISDICSNTLKIKVNNNNSFADLSFSQAVVKSGNTSSGYNDQRLYKDMLRHITKDILNTPHAIDIYTNEDSLTQQIVDLDISLCTKLNTICGNAAVYGFKTKAEYSEISLNDIKAFYICGHTILSYILDNSQNDITSYNIVKNKMETAYSNNSNTLPITISFGFVNPSYFAIRLHYIPTLPEGNTTQLRDKTYKCFLYLS